MKGKQLLKEFKQAPWLSQNEIEQLIENIEYITIDDLLKLLDILLNDKKYGSDPWKNKMRLAVFSRLAEMALDKRLFTPYVRALKQANSPLRSILLRLIQKINYAPEHGELCLLLNERDSSLRHAVAEILKKIAGRGAVEILSKMVLRPDFLGASEALAILVNIGGHTSIPLLEQILRTGKPSLKLEALQYLSSTQYMAKNIPAACRAIAIAFDDSSEKIFKAALRSLGQIGTEGIYFNYAERFLNSSKFHIFHAALMGLKNYNSPRTMTFLEEKLRSASERVCFAILEVLEEIGDEKILPPLVKALGHKHISVRTRAGEVLARLGKSGKIELSKTVLWLLRSKDSNVRRMAVDLARSVPDPHGEFWPKLLTFLHDEDWWVRERVIDALMAMAGRQLTRYMVEYLSDSSDIIRRFAVDVLNKLADPKAVGALVRTAQNDSDWWVREKALEGLAILKDPKTIPYIIDIMNNNPELQWSCIEALQEMKAIEAAPHVAKLLSSPSSDIRLMALEFLKTLQVIDQAPKLIPLLEDPEPEIRKKARMILHSWELRAAHGALANETLALTPLAQLLLAMLQIGGEDLILAPNRKGFVKRLGKVVPLSDHIFTDEQIRALIMPHLSTTQLAALESLEEIDFSYEIPEKSLRFRANVFFQYGGLSAVFRAIKGNLANFESLGLPSIVSTFGDLKNGLIVIGGPTGSGKSTTLGAIIDYINRTSNRHIISMEDPIEIVHPSKKGLVNQREIGTHTSSFQSALRSTLRQDPDVILVGEMRDLATISFAITVAETGHLVFGTLHTVSADTTIDRLLNVFPTNQQDQIRAMLSQNLRAVVCQYLLKRKDNRGRILATEIMINNDAIANMIRKGKHYQIPSVISTSRDQGMRLMDQSLKELYDAGLVSGKEVFVKARNKKDFEQLAEEDDSSREPQLVVGTIAQ